MIRKYISNPTKEWLRNKFVNILNSLDKEKSIALKKKSSANIFQMHYFPYLEDSSSYIISKTKGNYEVCEQDLPVPPKKLWLGYGKDKNEYLNWGKVQIQTMLEIIAETGMDCNSFNRILDFGCGAGRMIRWLKPFAKKAEIWGTDISSEHIYWANNYLKPPFNFATTTTLPHLPFEDKYFDLIYAGSVFTHIDDLTEAWLLELKRILSIDGIVYLTLHEKHSIDLLNKNPIWKDSWLSKFINADSVLNESKGEFDIYVGQRGTDSQVFYDIDYFCRSVSNIFEVISVTPEAYGYQTAVLLKRKSIFGKK